MTVLPEPARYFPVRPRTYRMEAGLSAFGTDFGNGGRDRLFFQVDRELERYRRAKAAVGEDGRRVLDDSAARQACHRVVLEWMSDTLRREHPQLLGDAKPTYESIAAAVQEEFVVLQRRDDGRDESIAVFVSIPSGWRPDRIVGAGFKEIHRAVPGFAEVDAAVDSMVTAMIERGPYVRFVWTISADDALDHHPDRAIRTAWTTDGPGWLRVERQVSVPFAAVRASLFLIRVYLYPFAALAAEQRRDLAIALERMPSEIAAYKSLSVEIRERAIRLLAG